MSVTRMIRRGRSERAALRLERVMPPRPTQRPKSRGKGRIALVGEVQSRVITEPERAGSSAIASVGMSLWKSNAIAPFNSVKTILS